MRTGTKRWLVGGVLVLLVLVAVNAPARAADGDITLTSVDLWNAFGEEPVNGFAANEPIWISATFDIREDLAFDRAKVQLVAKGFGVTYRTSWMPVANLPGVGWSSGPIGLTALVPDGAVSGNLEVIVRLKKAKKVIDTDSMLIPVTILPESEMDWDL